MKKNNLGLLLSSVLMIVVLVLWFTIPAIKHDSLDIVYSFKDLSFGLKEKTILGLEVEIFLFSILNFLNLVFIFLGLSLPLIMSNLKKGLIHKSFDNVIIFIFSILVVVFTLLVKDFAVPKLTNYLTNYELLPWVYIMVGLAVTSGIIPFFFKENKPKKKKRK